MVTPNIKLNKIIKISNKTKTFPNPLGKLGMGYAMNLLVISNESINAIVTIFLIEKIINPLTRAVGFF